MTGPAEQDSATAARRVCSRRAGVHCDSEFIETVEAASARPDVNIERDDPRLLASTYRRHGFGPPGPPFTDPAFFARGVVHAMRRERVFFCERISIEANRENRPAARGIIECSVDRCLRIHRASRA